MTKDASRVATTPAGWRNKTWEARKINGVPLDLPSGVTVKVVRPRFEAWFGTAKMPEALAKNVVQVFGKEDIAEMASAMGELSEDDQNDIAKFMNHVIMGTVVEPKVVDKLPDDCSEEEMPLSEINEEDRAWLMLYVFEEGMPNVPVQTEGGEVPLASLKSPDNLEPSADPGPGMREVQTTSK